jgi:hypothetical protein
MVQAIDGPAEPERTPAGGAPLKLTPERQAGICDGIRAGVRPEIAAVCNGVGARTYYRWMQLGRAADAETVYLEFVEAVEVALAEWEAREVLVIGDAAKGDWHAAAWRLERRLPRVYGKLTVDELEQLLALTEKAGGDDGSD